MLKKSERASFSGEVFLMNKKVTAVAYPTIPIVFVSSVHPDRIPLHNSIGLAVTDEKGEVRTETTVEAVAGNEVQFLLEGKPVEPARTRDIQKVARIFMEKAGVKTGLRISSKNYNIYAGSSDAGAAAMVVAFNELFGTGLSLEELTPLGQMISESAVRALYGGMNEINVDGYPHYYGMLLGSAEELAELKIFALTFDYESRVSAQEIFQATRSSPFYEFRLQHMPIWIARIKHGLIKKDWHQVFWNAEDNCANAHYLIECAQVRCRKKEMMNACIDVEEIRAKGLACYWTAGGGKVINVFSWGPDAQKVEKELIARGYKPKRYKVAPGAHVIKSE